jgi:hypothetical protein
MLKMLNDLVTSKRFVASVGAVVAVVCAKVAGKFGLVLDPDTASEITKVICVMAAVFVAAEGAADHGSTAVKLAVEAGAQTALTDLTATQAPAAPTITPAK